ncbi:MAG TPA: hypothetical protein VFN92_13125 [Solirubrobacterales bacterium]|nr:hypothetical protein [Solirubrobacterales bacterium]
MALAASTATLVLAGSGLAAAATPTGITQKVDIELTKGKLKFVGPESVTVGDQLEVINDTNPKQVGPHTFSLVTKGSLPKTPKARKNCFTPKHICLAVATWHGFNPKTEQITKNPAKAGPAGWSTSGNATGKKGDSWFTEKKGETISQEVTAEAGSTLYYLCAVHPWMQGKVNVVAPVAPLPTPTS